MIFSIITPAFGQLDWLRLCVASVADQAAPEAQSASRLMNDCSLLIDGQATAGISNQESAISNSPHGFAVEHIIQDAGSPGIEEFAREMAVMLQEKYDGDFVSDLQTFELLHFRTESGYALRVFKEPDAGMYDAINKGISKMSGDLWAWLNCDEQYLPGTLAYVAEWFATHPEKDILCGDALLTDGNGQALSYRRIVSPDWHHTRLGHLASLSCASFYHRSVVQKGGCFDITWRSIGDAEWMARLIKKGMKIGACNRMLSTFAFTGQNTSESPLAAKEGGEWRLAPDAPSPRLRVPVILVHRLRKLIAGAYGMRDVDYAIYQKGGEGRIVRRAEGVGWNWPDVGKLKIDDCSLLIDRQPAGGIYNRQTSDWREEVGLRSSPERGERRGSARVQSTINNLLTLPILGSPLAVTDYAELSRKLVEFVEKMVTPLAVDFANTHVLTLRRHDAEFERIAASMDLIVPDGMPLVWVMNAKGAGLKDRVYGPSFTRIFLESCPAGMTHYLVGGSEECGARFRERMLEINPSLDFVGSYHGMCSADGELEEDDAVLAELQEKRPDFIWVGLGAPKQYAWIHRIKPKLEQGVLLAVGFAFDVNAGMKQDTPLWMQRLGLGWLHRMASEPQRLVGRYLKWNSLFIFYLAQEWLGGEKTINSKLIIAASEGNQQFLQSAKLSLRNWGLKIVDLFASEISDCVTGQSLGRGLVIGCGTSPIVMGHQGLPPLIPKFLPQKRLTYWKQVIGFTTHPAPDFSRLDEVVTEVSQVQNGKVMNLLLTHSIGEKFDRLLECWKPICPEENLWIAFGGTREDFEKLDYPRKVYIEDPKLRTRDHQRERQSYTGIFKAMAPVVDREKPDFIYLCEYDHLPVVTDLNERQLKAIRAEKADVMGHWLYRVDGTGHAHFLFQEADPGFYPFLKSISRRSDPSVVLTMFGSGSFWSREAFLAIATQAQPIECYLELYLPTMAHHLGFRVRRWNEDQHLISNLPSPRVTVEEARKRNCWTVHPVKELSGENLTSAE